MKLIIPSESPDCAANSDIRMTQLSVTGGNAMNRIGHDPKAEAKNKALDEIRLGDTVEYQKKHGQVIGIYSSSDRARWVTVKILGPVTRHFPEHTWEGWPLKEILEGEMR